MASPLTSLGSRKKSYLHEEISLRKRSRGAGPSCDGREERERLLGSSRGRRISNTVKKRERPTRSAGYWVIGERETPLPDTLEGTPSGGAEGRTS